MATNLAREKLILFLCIIRTYNFRFKKPWESYVLHMNNCCTLFISSIPFLFFYLSKCLYYLLLASLSLFGIYYHKATGIYLSKCKWQSSETRLMDGWKTKLPKKI